MRIGFFGGSFDPPHTGHLAVAEAAQQAFFLERVLLAPVGVQPLKRSTGCASYVHRLQMVELLCEGRPSLAASALDAPRPDGASNFTIHTLQALQHAYPDAELFGIAGLDSFLSLPQWHRPDDLLKAAEWIVVSRPGSSFDQLAGLGLSERQRSRVHPLASVEVPVSATAIRARLAAGLSCAGLIPEPVLTYIVTHHLYGA